MGSWQLEVGRMFLYVFFPVGMFHLFNQKEIFDEWVTKDKERYTPQIDPNKEEDLRNLLEIIKNKRINNTI